MATQDFEVVGTNPDALFTLKIFRGERMVLLGMNWVKDTPPSDFVGFAIEYKEDGSNNFFPVKNRLTFLKNDGSVNPDIMSSLLSPIQKFRWVHFPYFDAKNTSNITYRVKPVFMDDTHQLSYGDSQEASIMVAEDTYPGELNVAFTRGFVASQAFVDQFAEDGKIDGIIPANADDGLNFQPFNPKSEQALNWMGFEARAAILNMLDEAIADETAEVRVTAYDLNLPDFVSKLVQLGNRLKIIIDDSSTHGAVNSAESQAAGRLIQSAGSKNVQRQHMGELQHNKTIAVSGKVQKALGGSTNFSWRGWFVQNNNAVIVQGAEAVKLFFAAFDNMWSHPNKPAGFAGTDSAVWNDLRLPSVKAKISFSPHNAHNALLQDISNDIETTTSSLFYSLAFLYQTPGPIRDAITDIAGNDEIFVYGISDKNVGGLDIQKPDGNAPIAFPAALLNNIPEPFKQETKGGSGVTMHHKFVVIDFDQPNARVYMGSYNFSSSADVKNGENLMMIQDRKVAVSYMIESVAMFDHYEFRDAQKAKNTKLFLHTPPAQGETAWWEEYYTDGRKKRDRELFSK